MVAQIDNTYRRLVPRRIFPRLVSYFFFEGRPLTTKGQWINPLLKLNLKFLKIFPAPKEIISPIYIVGTGRSGTTVLGTVLSVHPDIGFLNEPKLLWNIFRDDEDLVGSYSHKPGRYRLSSRDATDAVGRSARRLYGWYLFLSRAHRVLDKYPEAVFRFEFLDHMFPDAKFIFLVRNGRDTCKSINSWSRRLSIKKGGTIQDWWGRDDQKWRLLCEQIVPEHPDLLLKLSDIRGLRNHVDRAAVEWIVSMREGLKLAETYPSRVKTVRYEDLIRSPLAQLTEIQEFCGLKADSKMLDYACAVLRPATNIPRLALNEVLIEPFDCVMAELGYKDCLE